MKLKILLAPVALLFTMILLIWFVYPAFSNGTDGVLDKYHQLSQEKEKLQEANAKSDKVADLWEQLNSHSAEKDILTKYIPEQSKEEEVIDNLNFMASSSGLSVFDLSVSSESNAKAIATDKEEPLLAKPKNITATFSFLGKYEAIKDVLAKLRDYERYNSFHTAKISTLGNGEGADPEFLQADLEVSFNYMPQKALRSVEEISLESGLDFNSIDEIKNQKSVDVLTMPSFQKGKSNPFLP